MKRILVLLFVLCSVSTFAQSQFITTSDGVKLYVEVRGEGTPCLYLHGGPGAGSHWLKVFSGDMFEKHFKMIYLDQRGVSRSSSPKDGNYSMERMVKDFEEVREALGIDSWLLLGHSFGGILEMGYQNACNNRIKGLMFINCTLCMEESFKNSWMKKAMEIAGDKVPATAKDTTLAVMDRMISLSSSLDNSNRWKIFYAEKRSDDEMNKTYGDIPNWNNDFSNKALSIKEYWNDFRPQSASVQQPVLFFYGTRDWAIDPNHHKGVSFPNMMKIGCEVGHMPFQEAPADLAKAIDDYCKKFKF